MSQLIIKPETIKRIEEISGQRIIRGGDKVINIAIEVMQKRIQELEKNHDF